MRGRACSLLSGGKDSNYALYRAVKEGYEIACIATVISDRSDSWMFQTRGVEIASLQAKAMGLAGIHEIVRVSGVKEREVEELAQGLAPLRERYGFDVVVVGGIASQYQERRFRWIAERLGAALYSPQWGIDPEDYMRELIRDGFRFTLVRIATMGLPCNLLGRVVSMDDVDSIVEASRKYGFHPALEGGEGETLVLWQPLYQQGSLWIKARRMIISEFECELEILNAGITSRVEDGYVIIEHGP